MKYITATTAMAEEIQSVLHTTIRTVYSKYYPKEVVDFYCKHHNREHILEGIASGNMGVLIDNKTIVGTGCFDCNHITGVYVLPCFQNRGYGSHILDCLEAEIEKTFLFPSWMHHFLMYFYMSIEDIKLQGMASLNWKTMSNWFMKSWRKKLKD